MLESRAPLLAAQAGHLPLPHPKRGKIFPLIHAHFRTGQNILVDYDFCYPAYLTVNPASISPSFTDDLLSSLPHKLYHRVTTKTVTDFVTDFHVCFLKQ